MPHSVIQSFNPQARDIYINTHFQHFQKTVEKSNFKKQAATAFLSIYANINTGVQSKRKHIEQVETDFLKKVYPEMTSAVASRESYRRDVKAKMNGISISSNYLDLIDKKSSFSITDAVGKNFNYVKSQLKEPTKGDSTQTYVQKYMNEKLKILQNYFGELSKFLDSIYKVLDQMATDNPNNYNTPTLLGTMREKAGQIAAMTPDIQIGDETDSKLKEVLDIIKKIQTGKITRLSQLGNNFHSKMFNAINQSMYEYVAAAAIAAAYYNTKNASEKFVIGLIKKGKLEMTGAEGSVADSDLGTTDFILKFGKIKVGYDVKANKETYTTRRGGEKHNIVTMLSDAIGGSMPHNIVPSTSKVDPKYFLNLFTYTFVNMLTMKEIKHGGIKVENAAEVQISKMYQDMFVPIQKVIMVAATARFIDKYLSNYSNSRRQQIIILLGDNILFLSEFLKEVLGLVTKMIGAEGYHGKGYGVGYVDIPNLYKAAKKATEETSGMQSMVKKLAEDKKA